MELKPNKCETTTIVTLLSKEFEGTRLNYIKQNEDWAYMYFKGLTESKSFHKHENGRYSLRAYPKKKSEISRYNKDLNILNMGIDAYIAKERGNAQLHFEEAIRKLAFRMKGKIDIEKITATTAHVGVNIDCEITDGTTTFKAQTIIASGEIQRPHYRYLINEVKRKPSKTKNIK